MVGNIDEKEGSEKRVTISFVLAGYNNIVHDARTDSFLRSIRVMHTIASEGKRKRLLTRS